jgi:hypothetical protein
VGVILNWEVSMLKTFYLLACAYGTEGWECSQEMAAYYTLKQRAGAVLKVEGGHIVKANLDDPTTGLTDDDLHDVARLHWCRTLYVGGSTSPHGLLTLFPMKRLQLLGACGDQFNPRSIQVFRVNRPDVEVVMVARLRD